MYILCALFMHASQRMDGSFFFSLHDYCVLHFVYSTHTPQIVYNNNHKLIVVRMIFQMELAELHKHCIHNCVHINNSSYFLSSKIPSQNTQFPSSSHIGFESCDDFPEVETSQMFAGRSSLPISIKKTRGKKIDAPALVLWQICVWCRRECQKTCYFKNTLMSIPFS